MKGITVSRVTFERIKKARNARGYYTANITENRNGTVSFLVADDVHECLTLLGDDLEQSIIELLNGEKK